MMTNKIGVMINYNKNTDILAEFEKIKSLELGSCQFSMWDTSMYNDEIAEAVKNASEKTGVTVSALWAGWSGPKEWNFSFGPATLGLVPPTYRDSRLAELIRGSDFAEKIGVNKMITHVGFLPENPADPEFNGTVGALRHLCKYMEKKGQYFLFETGQETPVTMLRTIQAIGTENLGINFDTANLILYGKANTLDALDVFGKYVMETHIKDGFYPTDGMSLGKECKAGEGKANIPAVVKKLGELGFEGTFTVEREISGDKQIEDIIVARDLLRASMAEA